MACGVRINLLFILLAGVVCALVNGSNFGCIDTALRWQVARSIRLGEPAVRPEAARLGFGIPGKDGKLQAWYGVGQSLVLMPFDILVDATVRPMLHRMGRDEAHQRTAAELVISLLMQSLLTACVLMLARSVILSFGFGSATAVAGALGLLFATTCLQYVQCAQENELLLTLALAALAAIRKGARDARAVWPLLAGMACGFAILVRLPCLFDAAVLGAFAFATVATPQRFLASFVPPVMAGVLADRWYHWHRFGELFSTYTGIVGRYYQPANGPANFPFSYPFWKGFRGTFFSLDKAAPLFDPLVIVVLLIAIWHWRTIDRALRVLLLCLLAILMGYAVLYARYYDFGGDVAWGHRYVLLPVQLLCLFAVPLVMRYRWRPLWALVAISVVMQIASTALTPNLEISQREHGSRQGVIWNRAVNLTQILAHREDPKRFAGIPIEWRTLNYYPFQHRIYFPSAAVWEVRIWFALLFSLLLLVAALFWVARRGERHVIFSRIR